LHPSLILESQDKGINLERSGGVGSPILDEKQIEMQPGTKSKGSPLMTKSRHNSLSNVYKQLNDGRQSKFRALLREPNRQSRDASMLTNRRKYVDQKNSVDESKFNQDLTKDGANKSRLDRTKMS